MRSCDCSLDIGFSSSTAGRSASRSRAASVGAGEAPADDLVQPLGGERVGGARGAAAGVAVSRPEAPWREGSVAGSVLERAEPGHLLDQVGLAGDVGAAERGHGDVEPVGGVG